MAEYEAMKAARQMVADDVRKTMARIARHNSSDPATDDLTVPLAIELAEARATINRITAERDGLKEEVDAWKAEHAKVLEDVLPALRERDALQHDIERLRGALQQVSEGDVPRPIGKRYRDDGTPSKHDQCRHGLWMYEDCGNCISEFATAALATLRVTDAER